MLGVCVVLKKGESTRHHPPWQLSIYVFVTSIGHHIGILGAGIPSHKAPRQSVFGHVLIEGASEGVGLLAPHPHTSPVASPRVPGRVYKALDAPARELLAPFVAAVGSPPSGASPHETFADAEDRLIKGNWV